MSEIHRKRQVLQHIKDHPGTARDLSEALSISVADAQMWLFRLYRAVLVSREKQSSGKFQKPCFTYRVNVRGLERLVYWKAQESVIRSEERLGISDDQIVHEEKPRRKKVKE